MRISYVTGENFYCVAVVRQAHHERLGALGYEGIRNLAETKKGVPICRDSLLAPDRIGD